MAEQLQDRHQQNAERMTRAVGMAGGSVNAIFTAIDPLQPVASR